MMRSCKHRQAGIGKTHDSLSSCCELNVTHVQGLCVSLGGQEGGVSQHDAVLQGTTAKCRQAHELDASHVQGASVSLGLQCRRAHQE
jgi:hypothetical protein